MPCSTVPKKIKEKSSQTKTDSAKKRKVSKEDVVKKESGEAKRAKKKVENESDKDLKSNKRIDQFKSANPSFDLEAANRSKKRKKKVKKLDHKHDSKGQNKALRYLEAWEKFQNGTSAG
jgi:hypothetical protein